MLKKAISIACAIAVAVTIWFSGMGVAQANNDLCCVIAGMPPSVYVVKDAQAANKCKDSGGSFYTCDL